MDLLIILILLLLLFGGGGGYYAFGGGLAFGLTQILYLLILVALVVWILRVIGGRRGPPL